MPNGGKYCTAHQQYCRVCHGRDGTVIKHLKVEECGKCQDRRENEEQRQAHQARERKDRDIAAKVLKDKAAKAAKAGGKKK